MKFAKEEKLNEELQLKLENAGTSGSGGDTVSKSELRKAKNRIDSLKFNLNTIYDMF